MKKLLAILILAAGAVFAQVEIYEEEFTTNGLTAPWQALDGSVGDTYITYTNQRVNFHQDCCIPADPEDFQSIQIYADTISLGVGDLDVRGYIWKDTNSGNRAIMLGFWSGYNRWVGFTKQDPYDTAGKLKTQARVEGAAGTFEHLTIIDGTIADSTQYYRVYYDQSATATYFMRWTAEAWDTVDTFVYDWGAQQFRLGAFGGIFNASGGTEVHADSLWASFIPADNNQYYMDISYPNALGINVFKQDTLEIAFDATNSNSDSTLIYYSLDGGVTYTFITWVASTETTYDWYMNVAASDSALIHLTNGDSSITTTSENMFTINPYSEIDIYNVNPTTLAIYQTGYDTVFVRSSRITSFNLFWSNDSSTWHLIESAIAVDTVNGFSWDSTTYVWSIDPAAVNGITLWLHAEENRDTATTKSILDEWTGSAKHNQFVCKITSGTWLRGYGAACAEVGSYTPNGLMIGGKTLDDPSCMWSSTTWGLIQHEVVVTDTLSWLLGYSNHTNDVEVCVDPTNITSFVTWDARYNDTIKFINSTSDTTIYQWSDVSSEDADSVFLLNWWYVLGDDYVMGRSTITGLIDTLMDFSIDGEIIGLWELPIDVLRARSVREGWDVSATTYEIFTELDATAYADSIGFIPKLMVGPGAGGGHNAFVYMDVWASAEINSELAEDTYSQQLTITTQRNYFRGIHPKILKE